MLLAGAVVLAAAITTVVLLRDHRQPPRMPLGLRTVATIPLPGNTSRFDYASLDPQRGLLFIAHLGAGQVIEVDIHAGRVVRTIGNLPGVHGVIVVPDLHRVFATATGTNELVILDEDTGTPLARGPTGAYPDGLAYDPEHHTVWTTNESGGSETVFDATTAAVRGTVALGGEAGNVYYDATTGQMLVDVQTRDELAVVDTTTDSITRRVALPGCDHDHGLTVDAADRLAFVACDGNATLLTVDLNTWQILDRHRVGQDPDVLAYDPDAQRLYVAAESGWLTTVTVHNRRSTVTGSSHLADGAHVVAVDPATHRSYYPIPAGPDGHPALLVVEPTPTR
jgi:DNA-binding beta-propeller fold protein YncE